MSLPAVIQHYCG